MGPAEHVRISTIGPGIGISGEVHPVTTTSVLCLIATILLGLAAFGVSLSWVQLGWLGLALVTFAVWVQPAW